MWRRGGREFDEKVHRKLEGDNRSSLFGPCFKPLSGPQRLDSQTTTYTHSHQLGESADDNRGQVLVALGTEMSLV